MNFPGMRLTKKKLVSFDDKMALLHRYTYRHPACTSLVDIGKRTGSEIAKVCDETDVCYF